MASKIAVLTYSMYGHINTLAAAVVQGLESAGAHVTRYQIRETLPDDVLAKMHAPPKPTDIKVLEDPKDLTQFDGIILGAPTRYGRVPAQVSALFDQTGGLWLSGGLHSKYFGFITSTGGQHGGQEVTALTTLPWAAHHGMIYVPIGYTCKELSDTTEVLGGTPWGASTLAGDGTRQVHAKELSVATYQGSHFAKIVNAAVKGRSLIEQGVVPARAEPTINNATTTTTTNTDSGYKVDEPQAEPNLAVSQQVLNPVPQQSKEKVGFGQKLAMSCGGGRSNYES